MANDKAYQTGRNLASNGIKQLLKAVNFVQLQRLNAQAFVHGIKDAIAQRKDLDFTK